jgi:hypothetical protein
MILLALPYLLLAVPFAIAGDAVLAVTYYLKLFCCLARLLAEQLGLRRSFT